MNKKYLNLAILFLMLQLSNVAFAYDYFAIGKQFYNKGEYESANKAFLKAIKDNSCNVNYKYYLAQTYIHLGDIESAKVEYENIIALAPYSEAARLSIVGMSKLQEVKLSRQNDKLYKTSIHHKPLFNNASIVNKNNYGENYINNASNSFGDVVHWNLSQMPISIFIDNPADLKGFRAEYRDMAKLAVANWGKASDGILTFTFVDNIDQANIRVTFTQGLDSVKLEKGFTAGLSTPYYIGNILKYNNIKLLAHKPDGEGFSNDEIYNTVLHELGHALGIYGHSNVKGDVMYPVVVIEGNVGKIHLSKRDINTIKLLYDIDANISNFTDAELAQLESNKDSTVVIKDKTDRLDSKLVEAMEYVKQVPSSHRGWLNLANIYKSKKDYSSAITNFNKVLSIDPKNLNALYGLADVHEKNGSLNKAEYFYKKIVSVKPKSIDDNLNYAKFCIRQQDYANANNVIQKFITKNPGAQHDVRVKEIMDYLSKK